MNAGHSPGVRLAHFSDIHVSSRDTVWSRSDWLSKRMAAWLNLRLLGRGHSFRSADRVLIALAADLKRQNFDRLLFSGDATSLGFEEEVARAAKLLGVGSGDASPGLAVPGNHDYMTHGAARSGQFERHFAPWQQGERVDVAAYPFAQRAGSVWLIAVNSAAPNRWAWDASGRVGAEQLNRLERLLGQLHGGPRVIVTHYPIWLADGRRERRSRQLHDVDDLIEVCARGGVSLWLHGHRHHDYHNPALEHVPFPVICAGSATQHGRWSYKDYTIVGHHLRAVTRVFDDRTDSFRESASHEMELPSESRTNDRR